MFYSTIRHSTALNGVNPKPEICFSSISILLGFWNDFHKDIDANEYNDDGR